MDEKDQGVLHGKVQDTKPGVEEKTDREKNYITGRSHLAPLHYTEVIVFTLTRTKRSPKQR